MSEIVVRAQGQNAELIIANIREQLDVQFGEGRWHLIEYDETEPDGGLGGVLTMLEGNPSIEIALSPGGQATTVTVTMRVEAELLAEVALPRGARV